MNSSSQPPTNQPPSSQPPSSTATSEYQGGAVKWHDANNPDGANWQRVATPKLLVAPVTRPAALEGQAQGAQQSALETQTKRLLLLIAVSLSLHAVLVISLWPYAFGEHKIMLAAALTSAVGVILAAMVTLTTLRRLHVTRGNARG